MRDSKLKAEMSDTLSVNNPAAEGVRNAPVVVVACAELGKSGYNREGNPSTDKGDWYMFDVALAMQNLTLAAHAFGLGTVHIGAFDAGKVAGLLQVPSGYCVVEMTPLGYPEGEPRGPSRREVAESVFYERFGTR